MLTTPDVNLKFNKPKSTDHRSTGHECSASQSSTCANISPRSAVAILVFRNERFSVPGDRTGQPEDATNLLTWHLFTRNNQGRLIQVDNLVVMKEESAPPQFFHFNGFKSATVSAGLARDRIRDGLQKWTVLQRRSWMSLTGGA